jgi:hypothetical protein
LENVDNPLHELEFVQNEMHSFHLDQERLEHRQCTMCKEAWPTRQNLASEVYICYRCKRDKKSPKKFSAENDMANVDLQVIVDEKACARYMAKYAAKGEPRSKSASEILKLSVSSFQNDDQVSSAFKKAMIQVAGDRDMAAQETAHMLLSLPLLGCTFSFVTISLDNSRKVNIDTENAGDEVVQKSALQEYAERTKLKSSSIQACLS